MKKGKFYRLKNYDFPPFEKDKIYSLVDTSKVDSNYFIIQIGKIHAILIDRIIFSETIGFITDNPNKIFSHFEEISFEEAKKKIDNTQALLSKQIFRR